MDEIKAVDVKIFPHRLLKPETTEKLLNKIMEEEGVLKVLVNGESLPKIIGYGPARGTEVNHDFRKVIQVKEEKFELMVSVGELIVTMNCENISQFLKNLEKILEDSLKFKCDVSVGIFTKIDTTVTDYLKYGEGFEDNIDPRMIGLVDPSSRSSDTVRFIG